MKLEKINGKLLILKPVPSLFTIASLDEKIEALVDQFKDIRVRKYPWIAKKYPKNIGLMN